MQKYKTAINGHRNKTHLYLFLLSILSMITNTMLVWLIPLMIWELVWKGIALWKAGRNNQLTWFVCLLIFNTVGILPIIYIFFINKKTKKK